MTTFHFETKDEDQLRKVGMSKERRVDPQIQLGLLVDPAGFPLELHMFEGDRAETTMIIPVLEAFQERHGIADLVVVADAGTLSANCFIVQRNDRRVPEDPGLSGHSASRARSTRLGSASLRVSRSTSSKYCSFNRS